MANKRFFQFNASAVPTVCNISPPAHAVRVCVDGSPDVNVKIDGVGGDETDVLKTGEKELYLDPTGGITKVTISAASSCAVRVRVIKGHVGGT